MDRKIIKERCDSVVVPPDMSIGNAMGVMDKAGLGILVVCDASRKLLGVITDGDFRRGILHGVPVEQPVSEIYSISPVVAGNDINCSEALDILDNGRPFILNHLPLVENGIAVGIVLRSDLVKDGALPLTAVIMAGGQGNRLKPLTETVPKPMLPVYGKPMIEHIIEGVVRSGIQEIIISVNYLSDVIVDYFKDGKRFGANIEYLKEEMPLGTAGSLGLIEDCSRPILVINGDILTSVSYQNMYSFHQESQSDLTMGVKKYDILVPYGVVQREGIYVSRIQEKPVHSFFVNSGMYIIEPELLRVIPYNSQYDMTDMVDTLLQQKRRIATFPILESWVDIGQMDDYKRANGDSCF